MGDELICEERGKPIFVKDPETGEMLVVERDERYIRLTNDYWAAVCRHAKSQVMRVPIAGGSIQVREVCMECGERIGSAKSQKDVTWVQSLPLFTGDTSEGYSDRRYHERHAGLLSLARIQYAERGKFTEYYTSYMRSPEWFGRRDRVLKRCKGVCEGCGVSAATEVHHINYDHFGNEFLFELLGLCHDCHERIHAERDTLLADQGISVESSS